ncbi:MAG: hypothetical protein DI580_02115 [Cutibacterium acnes]|nr:MAG: hypothetical protein DI580_02115 [Cutibacterium acnes]
MTHRTSEATARYGYLPSRSHMPIPIVVARVIVIGLSAIWVLILCGLWTAGHGGDQSVVDPVLTSFALIMDSGAWASYLLIPVAGCVLTVTMGRGHAIDRYLFTALSLGWMWRLSRGIELIGGLGVIGIMAIALVLAVVWSAPVNAWVKAVAKRDMVIANPPEEGWLEPGQVQPWQATNRRKW